MDLAHPQNKIVLSRGAAPLLRLSRSGIYLGLVSLAAALLLWELAARYAGLPTFMLPSPAQVWARFVQVLANGSLARHVAITLLEILAGLAIGVVAATLLGYLLAKSRAVERLVSPYVVASQSVPIVAIAPLLVIWFGPGLASKVLICALIVFFPVLVNTIVGLRGVPEELQDLMRSLQATRWQHLRFLEAARCPAGDARRAAHRGDPLRDRRGGRRVRWLRSRPGLSDQRRPRPV